MAAEALAPRSPEARTETESMAIEIRETFRVAASPDAVWRFLLDPKQVVTCLPGAELEEIVDDRTFLGRVKVKVGAITASYRGRVALTEVDEQARRVAIVAEGREPGGGTARGTLRGRLEALPDGHTEVVAEASLDLTGRIMQMGRGMIQGVSHQLFQQFVARARDNLEQPAPPESGEITATEAAPLRLVPLLLQTAWSALLRFLRRLVGRPAA